MTDHPISPPRELVHQWYHEANLSGAPYEDVFGNWAYEQHIANRASQWGYDQRGEVNEAKLQQARDQELEACIAWFDKHIPGYELVADKLRAARRPKPPSLREEALAKTTALLDDPGRALLIEVREILELNRRALEALPDD